MGRAGQACAEVAARQVRSQAGPAEGPARRDDAAVGPSGQDGAAPAGEVRLLRVAPEGRHGDRSGAAAGHRHDGLRFAVFYIKVHDRLLRPLMASDQPLAPPALRQALRTIDREVAVRIAAARPPAAA